MPSGGINVRFGARPYRLQASASHYQHGIAPLSANTTVSPSIVTASLPGATAGVAYSSQLVAIGGTPPYTWSKSSSVPGTGGFPSCSSSGLISGTPSTAETETLVIQVSDRALHTASKSFSLPVAGAVTITNGQSFTFSGSGFGTNGSNLQLDDHGQATLGTLDAQWQGGHAPISVNPTYTLSNPANRVKTFNQTGAAPGAPHPFVSSILAGAHYSDQAPWQGFVTRKLVGVPTQPYTVYARYYLRMDALWAFIAGDSTNDHNLKWLWAWAPTSGGITADLSYGGIRPTTTLSSTSIPITGITINQNNSGVIEIPDRNGNGAAWNASIPTPWLNWLLVELEMCVSNVTGPSGPGYAKVWINGAQVMDYEGSTEGATSAWTSAPDRFLSLGPSLFARDSGPAFTSNTAAVNNWWYMADARIHQTAPGALHVARTIAGNATTYAASTIRADCIESSRTNTQITATFPQDQFIVGQTVYIHALTESGTVIDNLKSYTVV